MAIETLREVRCVVKYKRLLIGTLRAVFHISITLHTVAVTSFTNCAIDQTS